MGENARIPESLNIGQTRLTWQEIPEYIRVEIERRAGARVVSAVDKPAGFSPGLAAQLLLADGNTVFAKAVGTERNPDTPELHRQEATVLRELPPFVPAPKLLGSYDDGDWVALVCEHVVGHQPTWSEGELEVVMATLVRLAQDCTPSPITSLPSQMELHAGAMHGWQDLSQRPETLTSIDPWTQRHIDELIALEQRSMSTGAGTTLLHGDLRADNLLLTEQGVVIVDWPYASVGAPWLDFLFMLPNVTMHAGSNAEEIWNRFPLADDASDEDVNIVLASITGYFLSRGSSPAPMNLPRLPAFQIAQGQAALTWLKQRIS